MTMSSIEHITVESELDEVQECGVQNCFAQAPTSNVPTFATQANALLRKNVIFQMRSYQTNVCSITLPMLICLLLFGLQTGINRLLDKEPLFKCGCQMRIVNGSNVELCGLAYTTYLPQTKFCGVEHPPSWPALMQVPKPRNASTGEIVSPDFLGFSESSRVAAILYTGDDAQTAGALANGLLQNEIDLNETDTLIKYSKVVMGSSTRLKESLILETGIARNQLDVLQRMNCANHDFQLNITYSLGDQEINFNGNTTCLRTSLLYDASVSEMNSKIYRAAEYRVGVGDVRDNDFVTAYDFRDTSANDLRFNVNVFYNAYRPHNSAPPEYYRVSRPMNLAAQAFLRLLAGPQADLSLWFVKEMPKAGSQLRIDFTYLLGPLFYMWVCALLFPVNMITLVYEKQKNLRMMMKMHGLGDGPYWVITYGYFLVLSMLYFFAFVAFGSFIDLKFFRLNSYSIQFVFFFLYMNLQIALSFLSATVFQNFKTATVCGYMYVFGFGLLGHFFFSLYLEAKNTARNWIFLMELLPPFSLYRGLYELQQYATIGDIMGKSGMQWDDLNDPNNGLKTVFLIQIVEWFVILVIAFYLDQVLPASGSGMRRHPLFFLGCSWTPRQKSCSRVNVYEHEGMAFATSGSHVLTGLEMEGVDVLEERARVEELRNTPHHNCALVCDDLKKVYRGKDGNPHKYAVRGVSLAVEKGECFGMLGPTGAGKSTTINMMIGLISPTSGSVYVHGLDIRTDMNRIYTSMGVCPQDDLLWDQLTGREHLLFYGRLKNLKGSALLNAVDASLTSVDLFYNGFGDVRVNSYSGGMKRRLSVAISLIGDPKVVYMDEPGTGLDPASRSRLWNLVKTAKKHRAIILTTHSMQEAEALCDRLCIFVNGQLQCMGDAKELKNRYGGAYVLTLTAPEEEEQAVINLVQTMSCRAQKIYGLGGTQKFEIPKADVQIATIFATVVKAKKKLHIQPWGISDTTLEDVFIKVARDAQQEDSEWT